MRVRTSINTAGRSGSGVPWPPDVVRNVCMDICADMCIDMCADIRVNMCVDLQADTRAGTCVDTRAGMFEDTGRHACRCVDRHMYEHVRGHVCGHVCSDMQCHLRRYALKCVGLVHVKNGRRLVRVESSYMWTCVGLRGSSKAPTAAIGHGLYIGHEI